jgi:hypothetical protein
LSKLCANIFLFYKKINHLELKENYYATDDDVSKNGDLESQLVDKCRNIVEFAANFSAG